MNLDLEKTGLLDHQKATLAEAKEGFADYDRGKIIMALRTRQTYTRLIIAKQIAGASDELKKRASFDTVKTPLIAKIDDHQKVIAF
jgi:predicted helicase